MAKVAEIVKHIEKFFPKHLAEDYDNVGLLVGEMDQVVKKIYLTLDPTMDVIEDAVLKGADMIIAHHPYGLKSFKQVNSETVLGKKIIKLVKNNIALYAAHTNLDRSSDTINGIMFKRLGLVDQRLLVQTHKTDLYKVVVYVPVSHVDSVREAMGDVGAGHIGEYSHCAFYQDGIGTFKPSQKTTPYLGEKGELNKVNEIRIETIVEPFQMDQVIQAMKKAHPYEEIAYDIYKTERYVKPLGFGLTGKTKNPISLEQFIDQVKNELDLEHVSYIGNLKRRIHKVAICSGSGIDFINEAVKEGVDVFITGDVKYHQAISADEQGISVIDASHFGTEKFVIEVFKDLLMPIQDIEYIVDDVSSNPIKIK